MKHENIALSFLKALSSFSLSQKMLAIGSGCLVTLWDHQHSTNTISFEPLPGSIVDMSCGNDGKVYCYHFRQL
jgi:hypothetical protein